MKKILIFLLLSLGFFANAISSQEEANSQDSNQSDIYETCMDACTSDLEFSQCDRACVREVTLYIQDQQLSEHENSNSDK